MLWVDDVKATVDYYVHVLGFTCYEMMEELNWADVGLDDIAIMFAKPYSNWEYNGPVFTGSIYLNTNNVDAWWEQLKDIAHVYYEIENFEYGMREFAIKDPNGYIIQFGQPIDEL